MSYPPEHQSLDYQEHGVKGSEVFLGGLARTVTEEKIRQIFSTCGEIMEIRLIKDSKGSLKGFGFVRFTTKEAADKAVKEQSGLMIDGKKIGVLPSSDQDTLFLGNLNKGWSATEFDRIARQVFPDVISVDLAMPFGDAEFGQKQQNRGFAFVKFSSHAAAARAYRVGTKSDFILASNLHPVVQWAEEEPQIDPEELATIKIAFVRNLPTDCDENYLKKLFDPIGKVNKVVLSRKSRSPVGFVHFAERLDLENAIKEMNEKTIQGPSGSTFKLQVEVARPMDKNRKRARENPQSKLSGEIPRQSKYPRIDQISSSSCGHTSEPEKGQLLSDPYEAAVVSLPAAVQDRLLRILRLGIASRFDMDIQCITGLRELPESSAISVLDQFMLSGAHEHNKAAYLTGLISRQLKDKMVNRLPSSLPTGGVLSTKDMDLFSLSDQVHLSGLDYLAPRITTTKAAWRPGLNKLPSSFSRVGDIGTKEAELSTISDRAHLSALDNLASRHSGMNKPPSSLSRVGDIRTNGTELSDRVHWSGLDSLAPRSSATTAAWTPSPRQLSSSFSRLGDIGTKGAEPSAISDRVYSSALDSFVPHISTTTAARSDDLVSRYSSTFIDYPLSSRAATGREEEKGPIPLHTTADSSTPYSAHLTSAEDHPLRQPQVRFDPFSGEPYKFDPFTGEPIRPESLPRHFGSPY